MSEKATGFQEADKWLEGATRAAHEYRCRLREETESEPHCYADNLMRVAHHIKGQRDELASIAGEMAGAFKTALREIKMTYKDDPDMFDEDWEPSLAALSRYTAFMEGKG